MHDFVVMIYNASRWYVCYFVVQSHHFGKAETSLAAIGGDIIPCTVSYPIIFTEKWHFDFLDTVFGQ